MAQTAAEPGPPWPEAVAQPAPEQHGTSGLDPLSASASGPTNLDPGRGSPEPSPRLKGHGPPQPTAALNPGPSAFAATPPSGSAEPFATAPLTGSLLDTLGAWARPSPLPQAFAATTPIPETAAASSEAAAGATPSGPRTLQIDVSPMSFPLEGGDSLAGSLGTSSVGSPLLAASLGAAADDFPHLPLGDAAPPEDCGAASFESGQRRPAMRRAGPSAADAADGHTYNDKVHDKVYDKMARVPEGNVAVASDGAVPGRSTDARTASSSYVATSRQSLPPRLPTLPRDAPIQAAAAAAHASPTSTPRTRPHRSNPPVLVPPGGDAAAAATAAAASPPPGSRDPPPVLNAENSNDVDSVASLGSYLVGEETPGASGAAAAAQRIGLKLPALDSVESTPLRTMTGARAGAVESITFQTHSSGLIGSPDTAAFCSHTPPTSPPALTKPSPVSTRTPPSGPRSAPPALQFQASVGAPKSTRRRRRRRSPSARVFQFVSCLALACAALLVVSSHLRGAPLDTQSLQSTGQDMLRTHVQHALQVLQSSMPTAADVESAVEAIQSRALRVRDVVQATVQERVLQLLETSDAPAALLWRYASVQAHRHAVLLRYHTYAAWAPRAGEQGAVEGGGDGPAALGGLSDSVPENAVGALAGRVSLEALGRCLRSTPEKLRTRLCAPAVVKRRALTSCGASVLGRAIAPDALSAAMNCLLRRVNCSSQHRERSAAQEDGVNFLGEQAPDSGGHGLLAVMQRERWVLGRDAKFSLSELPVPVWLELSVARAAPVVREVLIRLDKLGRVEVVGPDGTAVSIKHAVVAVVAVGVLVAALAVLACSLAGSRGAAGTGGELMPEDMPEFSFAEADGYQGTGRRAVDEPAAADAGRVWGRDGEGDVGACQGRPLSTVSRGGASDSGTGAGEGSVTSARSLRYYRRSTRDAPAHDVSDTARSQGTAHIGQQ